VAPAGNSDHNQGIILGTTKPQGHLVIQIVVARHLRLAASLLGLIALAGCATGPTIRSNVDQSVDFTRFRTFDFLQPLSTDREGYQSFISRDLMVAAEREMTALGFQRTSTNPDLLVNFSANLEQRLRVTQTPTAGGGAAWGSHRRSASYGVWGGYRTDVRQDTMGTVGVDVIDAARRQLVWEGVAVGRVTRSTAENVGPALDSAVRDIFQQFPARVGK
jgi:hypothetical protein